MSSLPPEILELIVDELAIAGRGPWKGLLKDLKSCCLAAKAFVPHCQKHIFRSIHLQPGGPKKIGTHRWKIPNTTRAFCRTTFSDELEPSVHLASYVRNFKYEADIYRDAGFIPSGFQGLQRVVNANISVTLHAISYNAIAFDLREAPSPWIGAFLSVIMQPSIRTLVLRNLVFPCQLLVDAPSLDDLTLLDCVFRSKSVNWSVLPQFSLDRVRFARDHKSADYVYLKRLTTDSSSAVHCAIIPPPNFKNSWAPRIRLEELEYLKFDVQGIEHYDRAEHVLQLTEQLRELKLTVEAVIDEDTIFPPFPMQKLHPQSFGTLVRLELSLVINWDWELIPLNDPYFGFCDETLPQLRSLEALDLTITFQGEVAEEQNAYGPQWGRLDTVLVDQKLGVCRLESLKALKILVRMDMTLGRTVVNESDLELPYEMDEKLLKLVSPRFFGLRTLDKAGVLSFRFDTEVVGAETALP